jgi:hypothetical protein
VNAVAQWMNTDRLLATVRAARMWFVVNVLTFDTLGQLAAVVVAFVIARSLTPRVRAVFDGRVIAPRLSPRGRGSRACRPMMKAGG